MKVAILGGGQLGRMLALAGYPLGLNFRFLDPVGDSPTAPIAEQVTAAFDDQAALTRLAAEVAAVTYEFENVPVATARFVAERTPIFPPPAALEAAQDRLNEKTLFKKLGIPVHPFAAVNSQAELDSAVEAMGLPAVLKTRRLGYDGKGQKVLRSPDDAKNAFAELGGVPLILEKFVPFETEASILAVRSTAGETAFYPLVENEHRAGILHLSRVPAGHGAAHLQPAAERYARMVLEELGYVGVLAIEFFVAGGQLLANEMAPRVHNSGHWTIEGAETSQFENHLRAGLGLPLGSTRAPRPAAMLNIVGTMPATQEVLKVEGAHLHLYGKEPRAGRKLGHITVLADSVTALDEKLEALAPLLR